MQVQLFSIFLENTHVVILPKNLTLILHLYVGDSNLFMDVMEVSHLMQEG